MKIILKKKNRFCVIIDLYNLFPVYANEVDTAQKKGLNEANNQFENAKIKANVLELEREKRSEGLECWRDLMFLKKYLMVSLKDYWELVRRQNDYRLPFRCEDVF